MGKTARKGEVVVDLYAGIGCGRWVRRSEGLRTALRLCPAFPDAEQGDPPHLSAAAPQVLHAADARARGRLQGLRVRVEPELRRGPPAEPRQQPRRRPLPGADPAPRTPARAVRLEGAIVALAAAGERGLPPRAEQVLQGDNRHLAPKRVADRVLLGLLPSSEPGWQAVRGRLAYVRFQR